MGAWKKTRPDAITAFTAHFAAERERARRFAARLSLRRGDEYLASFDSEEHRLRAFARWLKAEGRGFVSTEVRHGGVAGKRPRHSAKGLA
jgi:hypothetical protein